MPEHSSNDPDSGKAGLPARTEPTHGGHLRGGAPGEWEEQRLPLWSQPWFPVLLATALALVFLAYILLPGVLLYNELPAAEHSDATSLAAQRATNQALEERIGILQAVLDKAQCRSPEGLVVPGGLSPMPGLPAGLPTTVSPQTLLPPMPDRSVVTPPNQPSAPVSETGDPGRSGITPGGRSMRLPALLDVSTVLVLAIGPDGKGSMGSGVVVTPNRVLTNRHVVDAARGNPQTKLLLANQALGHIVAARLVASTEPGEAPLDLALLESGEIGALTPLPLAGSIERMGSVVAAGYPNAIVQFDEAFARLRQGDVSAVPQLVITSGMVTVIQNPDTLPIVGHTAAISSGNSGGPLIDLCGRIIGINTFAPRDLQTISYAQSAQIVRAFLARNDVDVSFSDSRCEPETAADAPPVEGRSDIAPSADTVPSRTPGDAPRREGNPSGPAK